VTKRDRIGAGVAKILGCDEYYGDLLNAYADSGLSPPNFISEIEAGEEPKFWSCVWEAMLYAHLRSAGFSFRAVGTKAGQNGPDFCVDWDGKTIWIEAVVPKPVGIPDEYILPERSEEAVARRIPDKERVLRCASVISDKQKKFTKYIESGIVKKSDCTVIAINVCQLAPHDFGDKGVSGYPLALEAVLPVGPLAAVMAPDGKIDGPAFNQYRPSIPKQKGAEVPADKFLQPNFGNISAILQGHQRHMPQGKLDLGVIHNPSAAFPLPERILGSRVEFVVDRSDGDFRIKNISTDIVK
jgi:type I restriction enzyme S subunit